VFITPTRPLVEQQFQACKAFMGIHKVRTARLRLHCSCRWLLPSTSVYHVCLWHAQCQDIRLQLYCSGCRAVQVCLSC
jgi:hypothetical protein